MKSIRQLLRQPMKTLMGVLLVALAVAVLCVSLGQCIAAKQTEQYLNSLFRTAAFPAFGYEQETEQWLQNYGAENPEVVADMASHRLAAAYIASLVPDNYTNHLFESAGAPGYQPTADGHQFTTAMLVVEVTQITEWMEVSGIVREVVALEQGYANPVDYRVTLRMPEMMAQELEIGKQYLVYTQSYEDDWELRKELALQYKTELLPYFDEAKLELHSSPLHPGAGKYDSGEHIFSVSAAQVNRMRRVLMEISPAEGLPTVAELNEPVDAFLARAENALWRETLEDIGIQNHSFPIIGVEQLQYVADFLRGTAEIIEGRDFHANELADGSPVCLISEEVAKANGLTVGDKLPLSFFEADMDLPGQYVTNRGNPVAWLYGGDAVLQPQREFTIIGVYRRDIPWESAYDNYYAFTPNTIFTPQNALPQWAEEDSLGPWNTVILHGSGMEKFIIDAGTSGFDGQYVYYDSGFENVAAGLTGYQKITGRVLVIGLAVYGVITLLFLILYPIRQRKQMVSMERLGAGRWRRMVHVVSSNVGILVPGAVLGALLGILLWNRVVQAVLQAAESDLAVEMNMLWLVAVAAAQLAFVAVIVLGMSVFLSASRGLSRGPKAPRKKAVPVPARKHPLRKISGMSLGVLALALVLTASLCGLNWAEQVARANYEEICRTAPITMSVTNLTGFRTDDLSLPSWTVTAFRNNMRARPTLKDYVENVQVKMTGTDVVYAFCNEEEVELMQVIGLTDFEVDPELAGRVDQVVTWFEGFDSTILTGQEMVCLVPESWMAEGSSVDFWYSGNAGFYRAQMKIIGTHKLGDARIYCPYTALTKIYKGCDAEIRVDCVRATLKDNALLEDARIRSKNWFAEPDLRGRQVRWDYSWYVYYPYALKIDDSQLTSAAENLENSLLMNQICTVLVFVMAAGASFFVGFLMIRSRKREILLMRTMGTPPLRIFCRFAAEQLGCLFAGILLGGVAFRWKPVEQTMMLAAVYVVGLTMAMVIFLGKNLMSTLKEDE